MNPTTGAEQPAATETSLRSLADLEADLAPSTRELLTGLSDREREAFVLSESGVALRHIVERMGVTRNRIAQLREAATTKVTDAARRQALRAHHVPVVLPHGRQCPSKPCPVPIEMRGVLTMPIEALRFDEKARNCLAYSGIANVGDLVSKSESDMLKLRNFGRKSLRRIKDELAAIGLHLGMDTRAHDER